METTILIVAIFILTCISGYCAGAEAALFSLSTTRIKVYNRDPEPTKRLIAALLARPSDLLITIFMLNTLVNILLQNSAAMLFGESAGWGLKVVFPLVLTLIFGEILPKYVGLQNNFSISFLVAPSISILQNILKPIRRATNAVTVPISRAMFFFLKKEPEISKEEMHHILKTSEERGIFTQDEGEAIKGYLHLQEATVKEIMHPREEILSYDIHEPLTKLLYLFVDKSCSRVPVCDPDLDHIVGVITAKQYLIHRESIKTSNDLLPILNKPFYVPETTSAKLLMQRFHDQRQMLAIAVDEYGAISGLITREDLFEVVMGEITDSRDKGSLYTKAGEHEIIAAGTLELNSFNEIFHTHLISPNNMVTIGGWLTEKLGEIPKSGAQYEFDGFLFQILAATQNRVKRLYIRKLRNKHGH